MLFININLEGLFKIIVNLIIGSSFVEEDVLKLPWISQIVIF